MHLIAAIDVASVSAGFRGSADDMMERRLWKQSAVMMIAKSKIQDDSLQSFAALPGGERQSVIAELDAPVSSLPRNMGGKVPPAKSVKCGGDQAAEITQHAQLMDQLEQQLVSIVRKKPVRLNAAEAFVLNVSPDELRAVCELGLVGAVRPNRTHRV
jgi:hypothetical protein